MKMESFTIDLPKRQNSSENRLNHRKAIMPLKPNDDLLSKVFLGGMGFFTIVLAIMLFWGIAKMLIWG